MTSTHEITVLLYFLSLNHHHQGFLLHSCWRNPSLLIVQQCQSLATWLQFRPITSSRSSHQCLFGCPLGHLWSWGHHSVTHLVHLLSFSHVTCPAHWCLLVHIWCGAYLVDNINDTCLQADPACTFSVMQC